jgi:hypothetical protein
LGVVLGHDRVGDPWVEFDGTGVSSIASTSPYLSVEPAPDPLVSARVSVRSDLGRQGYRLGSDEMIERALRVAEGDASRAVDLLRLILR